MAREWNLSACQLINEVVTFDGRLMRGEPKMAILDTLFNSDNIENHVTSFRFNIGNSELSSDEPLDGHSLSSINWTIKLQFWVNGKLVRISYNMSDIHKWTVAPDEYRREPVKHTPGKDPKFLIEYASSVLGIMKFYNELTIFYKRSEHRFLITLNGISIFDMTVNVVPELDGILSKLTIYQLRYPAYLYLNKFESNITSLKHMALMTMIKSDESLKYTNKYNGTKLPPGIRLPISTTTKIRRFFKCLQ